MEIDIGDLWSILRQRLLLICILVVVSVVGVGVVSYYVLNPQYEATTSLLVKYQGPNNQIAYDNVMMSENLLITYNQIIKSRQVVDDVIANLNLQVTDAQLASSVSVKADQNSMITTITVDNRDPAQAVAIANAFADSSMQKLNSLMGTNNVQILDPAQMDPHPVPISPHKTLNITLAFVISLLVGAVVALLLERMDKTLKTEQQVEEVLGVPVLGVIPAVKQKRSKKQTQQQMGEAVQVGGVICENEGPDGALDVLG